MLLRSGLLLLAAAVCGSLNSHLTPMSSAQPTALVSSPVADTAAALPATDQRAAVPPHTLDTPRVFPKVATRAEWEQRRAEIRQQALISCGLYPLPPKTPLKTKIFGRVERDGYTIEKVYFQTHPGFYLAGNLYRPLKGKGKREKGKEQTEDNTSSSSFILHPSSFPGILIAHGHWEEGRMADGPDGSIAARAITFARQDCVAFTYDMVGYNDTRQIPQHRTFAADRQHWLWGISLMGLQTWNSVRALDFLASLPDVDRSRLAITGESGGGTQTMMLGAIDDRLAAVGPCVMVSHSMQGGCLCENAPGLRIDHSNMEIAAAVAPKPQIMVGATGDWTQTMMTIEGPGVQSVYDLFGQPNNLKYVIFPFNHNINKTSRDAVYQFFGKTLLHDSNADKFTEPPYQREPVAALRVFPDDQPLPTDAKTADQLTEYLKELGQSQLEKAKPHDKRSLSAFQKTYQLSWERTLNIETPSKTSLLVQRGPTTHGEEYSLTRLNVARAGWGDSVPVMVFAPEHQAVTTQSVVLLDTKGDTAFEGGLAGPLLRSLMAKGFTVYVPDLFLTGARYDGSVYAARRKALDDFGQFFTTYNRTDTQEQVQDVVTVCAFLHQVQGIKHITLMGVKQSGLLAMLAAPAADAVVADCNQLDLIADDALLTDDLFVPCLRRMGDFRTALTLAAPHPILLYNTGAKFTAADWLRDVYAGVGATPKLKTTPDRLDNEALVAWLTAAP